MDVVQRQVAPDILQIAGVGEQLADDGLGLAAEGTLEVAVLDDRDRSVVGAAGVVALGIDVEVEVGERLGAACERADPQPARQPGRGAEQKPRESVAISAAAMMPIFASASVSPSNASDATRSETVNPIPAIVPPPRTAAQPTGGRRRPRVSRVASQHDAGDPDRLADDVADDDPERHR